MKVIRKKLACWTGNRQMTTDFDEEDILIYHGLESCTLKTCSFDYGMSIEGCFIDSPDESNTSCSSSNNASSSFSSIRTIRKNNDNQSQDEWNLSNSTEESPVKGKPESVDKSLDVETMKERFSKILLGEDITGGSKGVSTALALSNSITSLAASCFGEVWKLEPLSDERKNMWLTEMEWLLSPANYMIELVPTKKNGINGRVLEIMTPKARADIHLNLPALRKLDSMLVETLDSMAGMGFWYSLQAETRNESDEYSKSWRLPSPNVPPTGLSNLERKKLLHQCNLIFQIFKAAKTINENVLLEIPVPALIRTAIPKSGKVGLGGKLHKILNAETIPTEKLIHSLNLKSENCALEAANRLEAAIFAWKEKIEEPFRRVDSLVNKAEYLLDQLKRMYPNLPQTFLSVSKVQYGKDVGHAILEAYSRVLANLAFRILTRIGDVLEEDVTSNPNSPLGLSQFVGVKMTGAKDSH